MPVTAALIAGGASILSTERTNRQSKKLAATAHQRGVKDLRKAGLNPILSATGGAGQGAATPQLKDPGETLQKGVSSALQAKRLNQELLNLKATQLNTEEQTRLIKGGAPAKVTGTDPYGAAKTLITNPNIGTNINSAYQALKTSVKRSKTVTQDRKGRKSYKKGYSKSYK